MRRLFSVLLTAVMLFSLAFSMNASADTTFTTSDALTVLRNTAGLLQLTTEERARYDLNNDGAITTADALAILRIAAGLPAFPAPMPGNSHGNTMNAGFAAIEGDFTYYACFGGAISRVRADGSGRQQLTLINRSGAATSPDVAHINVVGDRIYFIGTEGNDYGIYSVDINGQNQTLIMAFQGRPSGFMMTVAGDWIYYTDTRTNADGGLFKIRTDGTGRVRLLDRRAFPGLRFNVVGDWIYFLGSRHVERVRIDGSGHGTVITASEDNRIVHMSISNNKIFYTDDRRTDRDHMNQEFTIHTLYSANLDGSGRQVVLGAVESINHINAESGWVYFVERNPTNSEQDISRVRIDGTDKTTLISNIKNVDGICIAGMRLYYFCDGAATRGLYRAATSGGTVTEIT